MFSKRRKEIYLFYDGERILEIFEDHIGEMLLDIHPTKEQLNQALDIIFNDESFAKEIKEYMYRMEMDIMYYMRDTVEEIISEELPKTGT